MSWDSTVFQQSTEFHMTVWLKYLLLEKKKNKTTGIIRFECHSTYTFFLFFFSVLLYLQIESGIIKRLQRPRVDGEGNHRANQKKKTHRFTAVGVQRASQTNHCHMSAGSMLVRGLISYYWFAADTASEYSPHSTAFFRGKKNENI